MVQNSSNVRVAVTGAIYLQTQESTTPPTGADSPWGAGFSDLGYAGEDGVTETRNRTTQTIRAWQNGDIVREVVTEASVTVQTVLIETKRETVELYYGTKVAADGSIIIIPGATGGRHGLGLDIVDGDDFIRLWVPDGEISEVGDQVYQNGEAIGYEVTIRAYPHSSLIDPDTGQMGSMKKWYSSLAA